MDGDRPDAARGRGKSPGVGIFRIESRGRDIEADAWIERLRRDIAPGRTAAHAVVERRAEFPAVEREAVDHAGIKVRHE